MKRQIGIIRTGVLLLCMLLTGCGNSGAAADPEPAQEETVTEAESAAEEPKEEPAAAAEPEEQETAAEAVETEIAAVDRLLPGYQILYEVQVDGSLKKLLDVGNEERIMYADAGESGIYAVTEKRENDEGAEKLYFIDPQGTVHESALYRDPNGQLFQAHSFAVCDGRLAYHLRGDDPTIYAYDPETDKIAADPELTGTQEKLKGLIDDTKWALIYDMAAPAMMERSGCLTLTDNDGILYRFDGEGKEIETWNMLKPSAFYVPFAEHIVAGLDVEIQDYGNIVHGCVYDPVEHTIRSFSPKKMENPYGALMGASADGRYVYYTEQVKLSDDSGKAYRRVLYRLDTDDANAGETEILSVEIPPAFSEPYTTDDNGILFTPGRIRFVGDRVYYLDYRDGEGFVWMTRPLDLSESAKPAGGTDCDLPYAAYGKVVREIDERRNEENGDKIYYSGEFEGFIVRDDFPSADKINEELQELYHAHGENGEAMAEQAKNDFYGEDADEWMTEIPGYSYTFSFGSVTEPAKNYLQIYFSGYEYWGGAHGMPFQEYCLFDTRTGKRVRLSDLFSGGEDAFKEIVADYTLEDWKKDDELYYESYTPGDAEHEKEQRETFKASASLDMDVSFGEKGITVYYSPYAIAPYAAGYIAIDIPYSALGFELK